MVIIRSSVFKILFSFKDFIHPLERERERAHEHEMGRVVEGDGEAVSLLSEELDVGLNSGTPGS